MRIAALNAFDYILVGILLGSAVIGLIRGIFREAMSLLVWISALWVASRYAAWLSPYLADAVPNGQVRLWAARLVVFIGVLIVGALITWVVTMAVHSTRLGASDRVVGMVFGAARGVLLVAMTIIVLNLSGFGDEPWWRQSKLIPYAAPVTEALREAAEQGLGRSWSPTGSP